MIRKADLKLVLADSNTTSQAASEQLLDAALLFVRGVAQCRTSTPSILTGRATAQCGFENLREGYEDVRYGDLGMIE